MFKQNVIIKVNRKKIINKKVNISKYSLTKIETDNFFFLIFFYVIKQDRFFFEISLTPIDDRTYFWIFLAFAN